MMKKEPKNSKVDKRLKTPNTETRETFEKTDVGKEINRYQAIEDITLFGASVKFSLSDRGWKDFQDSMDAEPQTHPRMKKLLNRKSVFDQTIDAVQKRNEKS